MSVGSGLLGVRTIETQPTVCPMCGADAARPIARGRDYIYDGSDDYLTHVACDACGHIYLNPQPTLNALPLMYPSSYGVFSANFRKASLLASLKNFVNYRRFTSVAGPLAPGACVLDVGCGSGELLRLLKRKRPDLRLIGLDWYFAPQTRQELERAGIELIEGPLEGVDLPSGTFDLVLMYQLIEHLWDPKSSLGKLVQGLPPGGRIAIETPNTDGYDRCLFSSGTWGGYYVPRHLNLFNFERVARLLSAVGLEIVSQKNLPAPVVWCYSMQGALQERFGRDTMLARVFDLRNFLALGGFAVLDMIVASLGLRTSNQQVVARRPLTLEEATRPAPSKMHVPDGAS